jgi:hypothetical protein
VADCCEFDDSPMKSPGRALKHEGSAHKNLWPPSCYCLGFSAPHSTELAMPFLHMLPGLGMNYTFMRQPQV